MSDIDTELKLLAGLPIYCNQIPIYNLKLIDIIDVGYSEYQKFLNVISLEIDTINKLTEKSINEDDILPMTIALLSNFNMVKPFLKILALILHEDFLELSEGKEGSITISGSNVVLDKDNYRDVFNLIKKRNLTEKLDEDKGNPANEKARALLEQRKKARQKLSEMKQKESQSEDITIADLISILASGLCMNINDVIQYDMYQFNDQFGRLKLFKDFEVNIQALLAGAKSDEIELKHWLSSNKETNGG